MIVKKETMAVSFFICVYPTLKMMLVAFIVVIFLDTDLEKLPASTCLTLGLGNQEIGS